MPTWHTLAIKKKLSEIKIWKKFSYKIGCKIKKLLYILKI